GDHNINMILIARGRGVINQHLVEIAACSGAEASQNAEHRAFARLRYRHAHTSHFWIISLLYGPPVKYARKMPVPGLPAERGERTGRNRQTANTKRRDAHFCASRRSYIFGVIASYP